MKWVEANGKYKFVWSGDNREEVTTGVLRRLKLLEENFLRCPICKRDKVSKFQGLPCEDCLHKDRYKKGNTEITRTVRTKTYRDAVAFGYDKGTGRPLAVDSKGEKFNPNETIYSKIPNDPFGWKATGKKVKDKEYGIQNTDNG